MGDGNPRRRSHTRVLLSLLLSVLAVPLVPALPVGAAPAVAEARPYDYDGIDELERETTVVATPHPEQVVRKALHNSLGQRLRQHSSLVAPTSALDNLAQSSGILSDAARGQGDLGLGSATASHADDLGQAWVGPGFSRSSSNPDILLSSDGLRQYDRRPTSPARAGTRPTSNCETSTPGHGKATGTATSLI